MWKMLRNFHSFLEVQFSFGDMLSSHFVSSLRSENVFFLFVLGCCCRSQSVEIEEKRTQKNILTILFFSLCHRPRWWHDRNDECFSVAQQSENEDNCVENGPRGGRFKWNGEEKITFNFHKKKTSFSSSSLSLLAFFALYSSADKRARRHHDDDTMMNDVVDVRQWSVQKKSQQLELLCCRFIFQHFEIVGCRHFVTMVSR